MASKRARKKQAARMAKIAQAAPLATVDRQYAAARQTRMTGDWRPIHSGVHELLRSSRPVSQRAWARARRGPRLTARPPVR